MCEYYDVAVKGVSQDWLDLLECDEFYECFNGIEGENICPKPEQILNAFKLTQYEDVKVVIIGQDPYPNPDNAYGMAFSTAPDCSVPASLRKIYEALITHGHIDKKPSHGCLENWAKQGVLLLNMAFTCQVGKSDSHPFWKPFTTGFIERLCLQKSDMIFLLWGGKAQEIKPHIEKSSGYHTIFEWGHPSPMSRVNQQECDKNFKYCDHFNLVNEILDQPIIWDPDFDPHARNVIFTDGHCSNNGRENAHAGWGAYAPDTFMGYTTNLNFRKHGPVDGDQTNNRAELQAVLETLKILFKHGLELEPTTIITDSEYVKGVITEWMWRKNWVQTHKNPDIIGEIKKLLTGMKHPELRHAKYGLYSVNSPAPRNWTGVNVIWRRAAHDIPRSDDDYEGELYDGNQEADRLARLA